MMWKKREKRKSIIDQKIYPGKEPKIHQEIGRGICTRPRRRRRKRRRTKRRKISQSIRRKITRESIRKIGDVRKVGQKSSESIRREENTHQALRPHFLTAEAKA